MHLLQSLQHYLLLRREALKHGSQVDAMTWSLQYP